MRAFVARIFGFDREIERLKEKIRMLSWDPVFGMWTRGAFLHFCELMPRGTRSVVFLDFDAIHELNRREGYEKVDERVRRTFSIPFRTSDIIARWYSGDEIVILFDADPAGVHLKLQQLIRSARENGLSFHYAHGLWRVGQEDIREVVGRLASQVVAEKDREAGVQATVELLRAAAGRTAEPGNPLDKQPDRRPAELVR